MSTATLKVSFKSGRREMHRTFAHGWLRNPGGKLRIGNPLTLTRYSILVLSSQGGVSGSCGWPGLSLGSEIAGELGSNPGEDQGQVGLLFRVRH